MKKTSLFLASAVGLTVILYLLVYFFLPGASPGPGMVSLLAAMAVAIVWVVSMLLQKKGAPKQHVIVVLLAGAALFFTGCAQSPKAIGPATRTTEGSMTPPPSRPGASKASRSPASEELPRVTGTAVLLSSQKEQAGYGLYSYALLTHQPDDSELPRCRAFLRALLSLPTAAQVESQVPRSRVNITYFLLTSASPDWETSDMEKNVDYILSHYDYGRGAVIVASLSVGLGPGPSLVSVLQPLDPSQHPHPVLVQDLSLAQPDLMTSYVTFFKEQAGKDRFWQQSSLSTFALTLRNTLEVAAAGLGQSKDAVAAWIKFFK